MASTDSDLTLSSPLSSPGGAALRLLALTIQWHPERGRIGEQCMVPADDAVLAVNRFSPLFAHAGGVALPLGHRGIARDSVTLRLDRGDALAIGMPQSRMRVEVDGELLDSDTVLPAGRLDRGIVLRLGSDVILCVHWVDGLPRMAAAAGIVGVGSAMARVRSLAGQAARSALPVLLLGETGTGKEVVAQVIHALDRPGRPFVAVNMATLNESLGAAELFGAAKGAYTGAATARGGFFQQADGGTLFLDEIGTTPAPVQPMLLRVLQSGEYRPVGGHADLRSGARIIAATDQDLDAAGFNQPLLRRLEGFVITLPPLRRRREDIGVLLAHFAGAAGGATVLPQFPAGLVGELCCYDWPGNVRQLAGVVRRAVIALQEGEVPTFAMLVRRRPDDAVQAGAAKPSAVPAPPPRTRPSALTEAAVLEAMDRNGWTIAGAAQALGISRPSLYKLLDANPAVREPEHIPRAELEAALAAHRGDVVRCAAALRTPAEALRRHVRLQGLLG